MADARDARRHVIDALIELILHEPEANLATRGRVSLPVYYEAIVHLLYRGIFDDGDGLTCVCEREQENEGEERETAQHGSEPKRETGRANQIVVKCMVCVRKALPLFGATLRFAAFLMADQANKYPENVPGKFYVDDQCIDCDLCRETAPANFKRNDDGGHSYLYKQAETPEEEALCKEAMEGCPVEAIGNDGV